MPLDFAVSTEIARNRKWRGQMAQLAGQAAERAVARVYERAGADLLEVRWRGQGGEIDLIFRQEDVLVFCEVKAAATHDAACARLRPAQMRRIHAAASEYLGHTENGQLSEVRFDLATRNSTGEIRIMQNAFGHF